MERINAAIIGMGFIGRQHYEALRRLGNVRIRALCVSRPEKIAQAQQEFDADYVTADWRAIMRDPAVQVIHNCTPNIAHDEINLAAIAAGKHIYAEKPMSVTTEGAVRVAEAARAAGVANAINHQYRMNAAVLEMRARVAAGDTGRTLYVSGCYLQDSVARHDDYTPRRIPETSPARALLDIGVHWADTASFVLGQPIRRVYARMYTHYPVRIDPATGREIEIHSDDTTAVMVEFADGTPGSAVFSKCMLGHKNDLRLSVSAELAEIAWQQELCDRLMVGSRAYGRQTLLMDRQFASREAAAYLEMPAGHAPGWQEAEKNAMLAFYRSIEDGSYRTGCVPYATFEDGVRGNRFVDACLRSQTDDRWVELEGEAPV